MDKRPSKKSPAGNEAKRQPNAERTGSAKDEAATAQVREKQKRDQQADEASKESFPASDPPATNASSVGDRSDD